MEKLIKNLYILLYYTVARYLPESCYSFTRWAKVVRGFLCKRIFAYCGENVNVEKRAYFGNGSNIEIGGNSGIGINCEILGHVKIGRNVMMGPETKLLSNSHKFGRLDIPMSRQGIKQPQKNRYRRRCMDWDKGNNIAWG